MKSLKNVKFIAVLILETMNCTSMKIWASQTLLFDCLEMLQQYSLQVSPNNKKLGPSEK